MSVKDKHGHYHKNVEHLEYIDVYRILELFNVTSAPLQHAIKKLLLPGSRHAKDLRHDLHEARDSIDRALEMLDEDAHGDAVRMGMDITTKERLELTAKCLAKQNIIVDTSVFNIEDVQREVLERKHSFGNGTHTGKSVALSVQMCGRAKRPVAKKSKKLARAAAPKPRAGRKGHRG